MIDIPYKIIRSDRKSIGLTINGEAQLIIRAPLNMTDNDIAKAIKKKKRWIADKQKKVSASIKKLAPVVIKNGGSLLYMGDYYTIVMGNVRKAQFSGGDIILPRGYTKEKVIAWLKKNARKMLFDRVEKQALVMGIRYSAIRISSARTRWGSCSGKDNLSFTWRLIMCPSSVIDYVIVHELCHTRFKNHSSDFWAMVSSFYPDYKEQRNWLKSNRRIMDLF